MEVKQYKRIPVLQDTKKLFDMAYAASDCKTQDEFIKELLKSNEIYQRYFKYPSDIKIEHLDQTYESFIENIDCFSDLKLFRVYIPKFNFNIDDIIVSGNEAAYLKKFYGEY
jgi:hypothetical protein